MLCRCSYWAPGSQTGSSAFIVKTETAFATLLDMLPQCGSISSSDQTVLDKLRAVSQEGQSAAQIDSGAASSEPAAADRESSLTAHKRGLEASTDAKATGVASKRSRML